MASQHTILRNKILKFLKATYPGYWRVNGPGTISGAADIEGCYGGVWHAIEVKVGRDKERPLQEYMRKAIFKAGGRVLVARDLETVKAWMSLV